MLLEAFKTSRYFIYAKPCFNINLCMVNQTVIYYCIYIKNLVSSWPYMEILLLNMVIVYKFSENRIVVHRKYRLVVQKAYSLFFLFSCCWLRWFTFELYITLEDFMILWFYKLFLLFWVYRRNMKALVSLGLLLFAIGQIGKFSYLKIIFIGSIATGTNTSCYVDFLLFCLLN